MTLRPTYLLMAASIVSAVGSSSIFAQVPPDIAEKIASMGRHVDPRGTAAIYAPLQPAIPAHGVEVRRDIAYGPELKEKFDLFTPDSTQGKRPILIFVHGGAFRFDDKSQTPDGRLSPFYDNVMLWSVAHGIVGINMNYPLAPESTYPEVQQDIAKVLAWARANAAAIGGDPDRIFLWGHSAGASHVASFIARPENYSNVGGASKPVSGAILSSGIYDLKDPSVQVYFGPEAIAQSRASVDGLTTSSVPLLVNSAEFDPQVMSDQAQALDKKLTAAQRDHVFLVAPKHGHMSEIYSVNTGDDSLTGPVLKFINAHAN